MTPLAQLLEAALFSAARPVTVEEMQTLDPEASLADVRRAGALRGHFLPSMHFERHAGGVQRAAQLGHRKRASGKTQPEQETKRPDWGKLPELPRQCAEVGTY